MPNKKLAQTRRCSLCGGPIDRLNKVGICANNPTCSAANSKANALHSEGDPALNKEARAENIPHLRAAVEAERPIGFYWDDE